MSNHRYSKWWWDDYHAEIGLRSCSMAARGFWMELQYLCHQGKPYGHVASNGKPLSIDQIARCSLSRIHNASTWMRELEDAGVFSRTEDGIIFCRRMLQDAEKTKKFQEFGKRGGNPTLKPRDNPKGSVGLTQGLSSIDHRSESNTLSARDAASPSNGPASRFRPIGEVLTFPPKPEPQEPVRTPEEQIRILRGETT